MNESVLAVGASGIVGRAVAALMANEGCPVYGLARRPTAQPGVTPVPADLRSAASLASALAGIRPSSVVLATWLRHPTEAENVAVNAGMVRNLLDALRPGGSVRHVALVTGLKHYLGPFEAYALGEDAITPFREDQPRLDLPNFYYAQEDEVFAAAARDGFGWSVHRPSTMIGMAPGNAMNIGTTLAVYAAICRETGRPFAFPGSVTQWERLSDLTDARLLAAHVRWAITTPAAANEAFNVVNGDVVRWRQLWPQIADWFGIKAAPYTGEGSPLTAQMADDASVWSEIAHRHDLVETDIDRLISTWHTDGDLGRPIEVVTSMTKSRRLGFRDYKATEDAFFDLFDDLRANCIIP
jgi:nucleoside-diphosphate-sugar epimerase